MPPTQKPKSPGTDSKWTAMSQSEMIAEIAARVGTGDAVA